MCHDQPSTWAQWLHLVEFWSNSNFHSSIQLSPFEALYDYPPPLHIPYFTGDCIILAVDFHLQAQ